MPTGHHPNPAKSEIARKAVDTTNALRRMFGTPSTIGLVLMEAYYSQRPWVTVWWVSDRAVVSEATARRRLDELVEAGRALLKAEGRCKLYRANSAWADRGTRLLVRLLTLRGGAGTHRAKELREGSRGTESGEDDDTCA